MSSAAGFTTPRRKRRSSGTTLRDDRAPDGERSPSPSSEGVGQHGEEHHDKAGGSTNEIMPLRSGYKGPPFKLKHGESALSKLTDPARSHLTLDALGLGGGHDVERRPRGRPPSASGRGAPNNDGDESQASLYRKLAEHYQVTVQTARRVVRETLARGSAAARKRPGRPKN
jgi:hypothetical protein